MCCVRVYKAALWASRHHLRLCDLGSSSPCLKEDSLAQDSGRVKPVYACVQPAQC